MSGCVICYDLIDGEKTVSSTPCGHVFHTICLSQWYAQSKTCPECRGEIKKSEFLPVYFSIRTDKSGNLGTRVNAIENLEIIFAGKCREVSKAKDKLKSIETEISKRESEIHSIEQTNCKLEKRIQKLKGRIGTTSQHEVSILEKENQMLVTKLEDLKNIRLLASGSHEDTRHILEEIKKSADSYSRVADSFSTYGLALKQKLIKSVAEENQLSNELEKVNLEYDRISLKYEQQLRVVNNLKDKCRKKYLSSKKQTINTKIDSSESVTPTEDSCLNWVHPFDGLEPMNICVYFKDKKVNIFICEKKNTQTIVRVVLLNSLVTVGNPEHKSILQEKLPEISFSETEPDTSFIFNNTENDPLYNVLLNSQSSNTNRRIFQDYTVSVPPNFNISDFPNEAPLNETDTRWISLGLELTRLPRSIVINPIPEENKSKWNGRFFIGMDKESVKSKKTSPVQMCPSNTSAFSANFDSISSNENIFGTPNSRPRFKIVRK